MSDLTTVARAFVDVAHRIVWATVATVDGSNRPRSRVLHPIWEIVDGELIGWIATSPTPPKIAHLDHSPYVSVNYWDAAHDVATAECRASWFRDDDTCTRIWNLFETAPEPVGYDPARIPPWSEGPTGPAFAVLRLDPWHLRVFPGSMLTEGAGTVHTWSE